MLWEPLCLLWEILLHLSQILPRNWKNYTPKNPPEMRRPYNDINLTVNLQRFTILKDLKYSSPVILTSGDVHGARNTKNSCETLEHALLLTLGLSGKSWITVENNSGVDTLIPKCTKRQLVWTHNSNSWLDSRLLRTRQRRWRWTFSAIAIHLFGWVYRIVNWFDLSAR